MQSPTLQFCEIFATLIFFLSFLSSFVKKKSLEYVCSEVPTKHRQPDRWRVTLLFPRILLWGIQSIKIIKLAIFRPRLTPSQTAVKLRVPSASSSNVAVVWPWIRWRACTRVCVWVWMRVWVGCWMDVSVSFFLISSWCPGHRDVIFGLIYFCCAA